MARAFLGICGVALACALALAVPSARGAQQQEPALVPIGLVGGIPRAVAVWGTTAYVAQGWTIQIVDVADVAHPVPIGQVTLGKPALDLAVTPRGILLAALGPGGLAAFDLADPAAPTPAGTLAATAYIRLVAADGDTAYVVDGSTGLAELRVVEAARGAAPRAVGRVDVGVGTVALAAADGFAFVASNRPLDNVVAFDARVPGRPRRVESVTVQQCSGCPSVLEAAGHTVVTRGVSGLVVLESSGDRLRRVGSIAVPEPTSATDLVLRDGFAYLLCGAGVCAFDVANPSEPRYAGASAPPISAALLASAAAGPFVGVRLGALTTVDVTRPASPTLGAEMPLLGSVSSPIAGTSDPGVLLAGIDDRLAVLDAKVPSAPALAGGLDLQSGPPSEIRVLQIDVHGNVALVTAVGLFDGAVVTVDVSEPHRPRVLGVVRTQGIPNGSTWDGRIAYVTEGFQGPPRTPPDITEVFDLSDPTSPRRLATLPEAEGRLHLIGGHLVAAGESGVHVFDITAPDAPALVAHVPLPVTSSLADGDLLYVTTIDATRLVVFDLSEPTHPAVVGELLGSFPDLETMIDGFLVMWGIRSGIALVNVSNPAAPRWGPNSAWGVDYPTSLSGVGGRLYAAARSGGLHILKLQADGVPGATPPTPTLTPLPTPTWTPTAPPPMLRAFVPLVWR